MPASARIFPDTFYVNGVPIPSSYFQALDTAQSKALNGDAGGAYVPRTQIQIGGAGLYFESTLTLQNQAQIATPSGSGLRVRLVDSVPQGGFSRTIVTSFGRARDCGGTASVLWYQAGGSPWSTSGGGFLPGGLVRPSTAPTPQIFVYRVVGNVNNIGGSTPPPWVPTGAEPTWPLIAGQTVQDGAGIVYLTLSRYVTVPSVGAYNLQYDAYTSNRPGLHCILPVNVHDGAEFQGGTLYFKVVNSHSAIPAVLPAVRITQVDRDGTVTAISSTGVPGGWTTAATPGSAGAWIGDKTITIGSTGATIDRSRYRYFCEVKDENGIGALAGNLFTSVGLNWSVPDYRFQ